ncbi:MAG: P-loop NTPase [Waddliaceae bacterium]
MPLPMHKEEAEEKARPSSIRHVIAVAAGKGGVGKSAVAVNLAEALRDLGYRVGIMDADIYGPSIRKMLPEDRKPGKKGEKLIPALCRGVQMISMAYFRREDEAAVVRAPIANGIISQFIHNVAWGELDYLLIDFPPGTGDVQLTLSQQANVSGAIMVSTPQALAVMDVRKAMHLFEQVKVPIVGIVENMSGYCQPESKEIVYLFGKGGGEALAREKEVPFLGRIPIDPEVSKRADDGRSLFDADCRNDRSPAAQAFIDVAKKVVVYVDELTGESQRDAHSFELIWKEEARHPSTFSHEKRALSQKRKPASLFVERIEQKDRHAFRILWNDGNICDYRLSDLQRRCPCAKCTDEATGKHIADPSGVKDDARAKRIVNVGRYALRIDFTSGCSLGIYSFAMLRKLQCLPVG